MARRQRLLKELTPPDFEHPLPGQPGHRRSLVQLDRQALAAITGVRGPPSSGRRRHIMDQLYDSAAPISSSTSSSSSAPQYSAPPSDITTTSTSDSTTGSSSSLPGVVSFATGYCTNSGSADYDFPIHDDGPDEWNDEGMGNGRRAVAAASSAPRHEAAGSGTSTSHLDRSMATDSSDSDGHLMNSRDSDSEFETDPVRKQRGQRQRVRPDRILRVAPPARDSDMWDTGNAVLDAYDAEQLDMVVDPVDLPVVEVGDSGDDDYEEVAGIRLSDHDSDVDYNDAAAGEHLMADATDPAPVPAPSPAPVAVAVPAASLIVDEAVQASSSLIVLFGSLPAAAAAMLLPIILPFLHRLNAPIGAARWMWAWLYNAPTILKYLVTCLYASSSDYTQGLFIRVLMLLNTFVGTILVAMKLPNTIPALIKSNRWLAAFCHVDPMVMCPNCCTLHTASDCVVMVNDRPTSKVCRHVEYPEHAHESGRQACDTALLSVIKTKSTHKGDVTTLAPHPQNQFIYLGESETVSINRLTLYVLTCLLVCLLVCMFE